MVQVWHGWLAVIVYLAGLQGIPETYYEAARLDGASRIQQNPPRDHPAFDADRDVPLDHGLHRRVSGLSSRSI